MIYNLGFLRNDFDLVKICQDWINHVTIDFLWEVVSAKRDQIIQTKRDHHQLIGENVIWDLTTLLNLKNNHFWYVNVILSFLMKS